MRAVALWPSVEFRMGLRSAALGGRSAGRRERGRRKERRKEGGDAGPPLQNENPTPQSGWEIWKPGNPDPAIEAN
eukprot:506317-Pyramimonas_sp.AAC.1